MARKKQAPEPKSWIVRLDKIVYSGATAFVEAATEEEALAMAKSGYWDDVDISGASIADFDVGHVEINE